mmetsp:Transcript_24149/g.66917  ORF Transcript_24149/g.66917 Transcript_24149/m.66917 type:complete len:266 (-) Transcript_24149:58-855(-)|eukprot:CAMPEP_0172366684 /NCGR_PEP_ID=MMETSP1060-20121228/16468_1 /TAXON_ID=37318 /ORGANISM="Pseudo-nitzschia pungens, Strain cf. cingulata" /LENGTH=265 /DNA_ID=CAMNT_0013090629 /DNA_START=202 /DNA_END=999 /DNA_ORIENTATION=-
MIRGIFILAIVAISQISETASFVTNRQRAALLSTVSSSASPLFAKKKKKSQAGKGFGKEPEKVEKPKSNNADLFNIEARAAAAAQQQSSAFTSVDGGSGAIPTLSTTATTADPSESVEDRNKRILREKYGLRTKEEQEAAEAKQKQVTEQRKKINEWKKLADEGDDFDLLQVIPDPVLIFIDRFLKGGVVVCTTLFVLAGIAITVEAGSKATANPLPHEIDDFISNVVEPNFTPGLGVLLSFSVGLGVFASLQLNSAASTYRENK